MNEKPDRTARRSRSRRRRGDTANAEPVFPEIHPLGGAYAPLAEPDLARIHEATLDILERIGLSDAPPVMIETVTAAGGRLSGSRRLTIPRALVERALEGVVKSVRLCGQRPEHDMALEAGRVYTGTGGAAPFVVDAATGDYRPSTLKYLYDAARLCDTLRHVHFFSRSLVARDAENARDFDINTAFACLAGTTKHVMVSASDPAHVRPIAEMCYAVAGSEAAFRERPFLSMNINHVVPPLRFHPESCEVMAEAARAGIPVMANVFGQLGASSPVTIAGSVAQTMAEALAGVVFAWLADPAAQIVCGPRPMIVDLRTGAMSGGGGEQAQANTLAIQMMRRYGLPSSIIAGANLITQACGMQAGLLGVSMEAYVIDNDMLGAILRSATAVEINDETLALDAIAEVVAGEGHFLGRPETYERMKSDFLYPEIADRRSPEDWSAAGAENIVDMARERVTTVLSSHYPEHLDRALRERLRSRFDLKLDEADMGTS